MVTTTRYIYDGFQLLGETDETGTVTRRYINEPDEYTHPIGHVDVDTGEASYCHYDGQGNTRAVTDKVENVTDTFNFDSWGNLRSRTGMTNVPFQFGGEHGYYKDDELDTYYVMARVYDPSIIRWLSVDPLRFVDGTNRYTYTQNCPINRVDPSGLQGGLLVAGKVCAKKAFLEIDLNRYYHLCVEIDLYDDCCKEDRMVEETVAIELLGYDGDGRAPESARVGFGPSGIAGIILGPDGRERRIVGAGIDKAWGIFVVPGGKCVCTQSSSLKVLTPLGFAPDEDQCKLSNCLYTKAHDIATIATRRKAHYDYLKRNSNSFIGELLRACKAHVSDAFYDKFIGGGAAPGVDNDFTTGAPPGSDIFD